MSDYGFDNPNPHDNPAAGINPDLFLRCVHCGMCTSSCPTYTELGDENDSPRGRIQLMRAVADGRAELTDRSIRHLELCLDCRSCETACPSGVRYGRLIEPFRLAVEHADKRVEVKYDWFREIILFQLFPYADRMNALLMPVRWMQQLGLYGLAERMGLFKLIPGRLGPPPSAASSAGGSRARNCPNSCRPSAASGHAWRFSSGVWPTRCFGPPIGPRSAFCSRMAATFSFRPSKAAAARSITMPATAAARVEWPTPIWWRLSSTVTTPSLSITAAAAR